MPQTMHKRHLEIPAMPRARKPRVYSLSPLFFAAIAGTYALFLGQRVLAGNTVFQLNPDAVSYILGAHQAAQGHIAESMSAVWMPGLSWLAAPLVLAGIPPLYAVAILSYAAGLGLVLVIGLVTALFAGETIGLATALVASTDPLLLVESSAPRSDVVSAFLSVAVLGILLFMFRNYRRIVGAEAHPSSWRLHVSLSVLGALIIAVRIAALPLAVMPIGMLFLFFSKRLSERILAAGIYSVVIGAVILGFCLFFQQRLGIFVPSANFQLNKYFMVHEFIGGDTSIYTKLYDGKNTIVGDLQYFDPAAKLPPQPSVKSSRLFYYRIDCLRGFLLAMSSFINVLVLSGAVLGVVILSRLFKTEALVVLAWAVAATMACLASNIQHRFLLPLLPIAYILFGVGLKSLRARQGHQTRALVLPVLCGVAVLMNLIIGFKNMNLPLLLGGHARIGKSGGQYVYETFGPNRRLMTLDNYHAVVDARGRWRPMPNCSLDELWSYVGEKRIEFVILPWPLDGSVYNNDLMKSFMNDRSRLKLLWKGDYDYVYQVNPNTGTGT